MRKIILRILFAGLLCFLAGIICIATCIWMATQPPRFYAKLMEQQFTVADQQRAEQHFEELVDSIELWARSLAQVQYTESKFGKEADSQAILKLLATLSKPVVDENRRVTIAQDDINAALSSRKVPGDDLKDFRVQLADDRIQLAAHLNYDDNTKIYISADIRVHLETDGKIRFDLLTARLGRLPLPIGSILKLFGDKLNQDGDVQFDLDASPINITFNTRQPDSDILKLKRIYCEDSTLNFDLGIPAIAY